MGQGRRAPVPIDIVAGQSRCAGTHEKIVGVRTVPTPIGFLMATLTHLQRLEAESIDILREAVAESEHPVMLYSIGKDSSVMVRLAEKAFYPGKPPFPLMHVDTTWKFREMI